MTNDLLDRLERITDEPVVPLPSDRVAHIEANLRSLYPLEPRQRPKHIRVRIAVAAAIAAVLALVILNIGNPPAPRSDLLLTSATETVVVMPDGTRLAGRVGLSLPDGATVIVSPGGRASIGAVVITGGSTATIDNGVVDVRRSSREEQRRATRESARKRKGGGDGSADAPPVSTPVIAGPKPSPTTVRAGTPTPPPVTRPPTVTTTPATSPPATVSPTTVAPLRPGTTPARLRAIATRRAEWVVVRWQAFAGSTPVRYVVIATTTKGSLSYPLERGTTVVARTTTETTTRVPARTGLRLRVVALSDDNRVVAYSPVLTPT